MQVKVFRCVCGFEVRAMLSQECVAAFRSDPEAWQKLCAYSNLVQAPNNCPRFLDSISPYARSEKRLRRPRL
jgi:hypothetical protein